jgi:hypothetical protein
MLTELLLIQLGVVTVTVQFTVMDTVTDSLDGEDTVDTVMDTPVMDTQDGDTLDMVHIMYQLLLQK